MGSPMFFIRLAGCSVGKYPMNEVASKATTRPIHAQCTTCTGIVFRCDTDYKMKEKVTWGALMDRFAQSGVSNICLTGGEPFDRSDIYNFFEYANKYVQQQLEWESDELKFHIETSGTKPIPETFPLCWIVCSPKKGYLPENGQYIDAFKFLLDAEAGDDQFLTILDIQHAALSAEVFYQPINFKDTINEENLKFAINACIAQDTRLSWQLHKEAGLR